MPSAFTTTMLAWGMLAFPTAYQKAGEMDHATQTLRWGTDYLLKLYTPASSTNTSKTAHQYQIIYQVPLGHGLLFACLLVLFQLT